MYFTEWPSQIFILFEQWRVTSTKGFGGSIVAVLALAVLYECVKGLHVYLRSRLKHHEKKTSSTKNRIYSENARSEAILQFSKTCLFVAELSFANFLMLITMTYNTWLFIAVVIGRGLGYYLVTPLISFYVGSEEFDDCSEVSMDSLLARGKPELL